MRDGMYIDTSGPWSGLQNSCVRPQFNLASYQARKGYKVKDEETVWVIYTFARKSNVSAEHQRQIKIHQKRLKMKAWSAHDTADNYQW